MKLKPFLMLVQSWTSYSCFLNQGKTVTALDVADEMVELTKSEVKQINKIEDCNFIVSDYMTHNLKKFDAIAV